MLPFIYILGQRFSSWSFFMLGAFLLFYILSISMRPKEFSISRAQIAILGLLFFIFGLMGAKLLHIILYVGKYSLKRSFNTIWDSAGAASLGTHIFGLLVFYIYSKETKRSFLELADYFIPFVMLSVFMVRIGCLLAGCCHGYASSLPWATVFSNLGGKVARHPTQAYEMIYALSISTTVFRFYHRLKNIRGAAFLSAYFTYFFMRFFNELLRVDSPFVIWPFKLSHFAMATGMILCGIAIYNVVFKKEAKEEFLKLMPKMLVALLLCMGIVGSVVLTILSLLS